MARDIDSIRNEVRRFEEILSSNPGAYSFAPLSDCYRELGRLDDALETARRGIAVHPEFAAGQMALARVSLEKALTEEARQALEKVTRITPENLEAQRLLADIYQQSGEKDAAERCLAIIYTLDPSVPVPSIAPASEATQPAVVGATQWADAGTSTGSTEFEIEEPVDDEIMEADILELTDDLIEEESFTSEPFMPFAAAPERPSLQQQPKLEPAPPVATDQVVEQVSVPAPEVAVEPEQKPQPVATATIAELYISQGFIEKGLDIYRELINDDPGNAVYRNRLAELTGGAEADSPGAPAEEILASSVSPIEAGGADPDKTVETLQGWLGNIRRSR